MRLYIAIIVTKFLHCVANMLLSVGAFFNVVGLHREALGIIRSSWLPLFLARKILIK
jgi:hypothetical protein